MQIIPTQTNSALSLNPLDLFPAASLPGSNATSFGNLLWSSISNTGSQPTSPQLVLAQAQLAQAQQNLAQVADSTQPQDPTVVSAAMAQMTDPAMPASTADTSLRDVKMTQDDFSALKDKLQAAGVSSDTLNNLDQQIQSPQGLTWGQFMQSMHQAVMQQFLPPAQLTDTDKSNISSLLGSIGFSSKQADSLTDALANGKAARVFSLISAKLKTMDPGQTATVTQDQAASLAKAMKLPAQSVQHLLGQFGGQPSLELNSVGLNELFSTAKDELQHTLSKAKDAMKTVKDAAQPAMDQARQRLGIAQQAQNAQAEPTQVRASSMLKAPQDAQNGANGKNAHGKDPERDGARENDSNPNDPWGVQKDGRQPGSQLSGKGDGSQNSQNGQSSADRAWAQFASKIQAQGDAGTSVGTLLGAQQTAPLTTPSLGTNAQAQAVKAQAAPFLDQVQSGILKNLGQGMKQLTLELTPETLGKLNVMLTVKGKEVQAVLKADTPEAEKVLAENLHQIKQSLENQGLTVSKLEVRTSLSQDSNLGQQWAGTDSHNLSQERRDALGRMRTTSMMAGNDGGGDSVAQQMQNGGGEARISQGGLDIVA